LSWDFNEEVNVPIPKLELNDHHGTRCAGLIAAEANNGVCGVGVAFDAQISAIRILSKNLSTKAEAQAVVFKYHENHIFSCSWGPADDGKALDGPPRAVLEAFVDGLMNGRDGKGSVYVFASGNGKSVDNCNYDGYANGVFSVTIGAIDNNNAMPVYMEPCSAQLAVTYSSGYNAKIATTDLGNDSCTTRHGGTSAAAPLAAGIFALVLQSRPELTWRDMQYLTIHAAQPVATLDPSWKRNGAGLSYSQKFGFGKIDADQIVMIGQNWTLAQPPLIVNIPRRELGSNLPINSTLGLSDTIVLGLNSSQLSCLKRIEHVTISVDIEHSCRGELQVFLRSPSGMAAQLASRRPLDQSPDGLRGWTFMTVAFWGERAEGPWTLNVVDKRATGEPGRLNSWRMTIWGEMKAECSFDKLSYANSFINTYYPPSHEYFKASAHIAALGTTSSQTWSRLGRNISILLMLTFVIILVFRYTRKYLSRRYRPVASNTTTLT